MFFCFDLPGADSEHALCSLQTLLYHVVIAPIFHFYSKLILYVTLLFFVLTQTTVAEIKRLAASFCMYVCLCVGLSTWHQWSQTNDPKLFKLYTENDIWTPYRWYDLGLKGQRSRSQDHKVQNGDRLASMNIIHSLIRDHVIYRTRPTPF